MASGGKLAVARYLARDEMEEDERLNASESCPPFGSPGRILAVAAAELQALGWRVLVTLDVPLEFLGPKSAIASQSHRAAAIEVTVPKQPWAKIVSLCAGTSIQIVSDTLPPDTLYSCRTGCLLQGSVARHDRVFQTESEKTGATPPRQIATGVDPAKKEIAIVEEPEGDLGAGGSFLRLWGTYFGRA